MRSGVGITVGIRIGSGRGLEWGSGWDWENKRKGRHYEP